MNLDLTVRYLVDLTALGVNVPAICLNTRDTYQEALRTAAAHPSEDLKLALESGAVNAANVGELVRVAGVQYAARQHAHVIVRDLHITFNRPIREGLRATSPASMPTSRRPPVPRSQQS